MLTLRAALALGEREVVAFVGAGGKTAAMFRLARELHAGGARVVVTTTTRILDPGTADDLEVVIDAPVRLPGAVAAALARGRIPVVAIGMSSEAKLAGVPPDLVTELARLPGMGVVLVEADGAARRPFKAPRDGEPVIPACATVVVPVAGIDALGRPVTAVSHRPERVAALTGLGPDDPLDTQAMACVIVGSGGMTRGAPRGARIVPLVNKADDAAGLAAARELAATLLRSGAARVVITSLEGPRPLVEVARPDRT